MMHTSTRLGIGLALALATTWLAGCDSSASSEQVPDAGVDAARDGNAVGESVCGESGVELSVATEEELAALRVCTTLRGSLRFGDTGLRNVDGLESLRTVEGQINFFRNSELVNIDGLRSLEVVGGRLFIHHNPKLVELTGLGRLRRVDGELFFASNEALERLHGLEQLDSVGTLQIVYNDRLSSLQGLAALKTVRGNVIITNNAALPQAEAEAFAARLQVDGTIDVSANKAP